GSSRPWDRDRGERPARPGAGTGRGEDRSWDRDAGPGRSRPGAGSRRLDERRPDGTAGRSRSRGAGAPERDGARRGGAPGTWNAGTERPRRPQLPDDITAAQLDQAARAQLRTLPGDLADAVARWLVAA